MSSVSPSTSETPGPKRRGYHFKLWHLIPVFGVVSIIVASSLVVVNQLRRPITMSYVGQTVALSGAGGLVVEPDGFIVPEDCLNGSTPPGLEYSDIGVKPSRLPNTVGPYNSCAEPPLVVPGNNLVYTTAYDASLAPAVIASHSGKAKWAQPILSYDSNGPGKVWQLLPGSDGKTLFVLVYVDYPGGVNDAYALVRDIHLIGIDAMTGKLRFHLALASHRNGYTVAARLTSSKGGAVAVYFFAVGVQISGYQVIRSDGHTAGFSEIMSSLLPTSAPAGYMAADANGAVLLAVSDRMNRLMSLFLFNPISAVAVLINTDPTDRVLAGAYPFAGGFIVRLTEINQTERVLAIDDSGRFLWGVQTTTFNYFGVSSDRIWLLTQNGNNATLTLYLPNGTKTSPSYTWSNARPVQLSGYSALVASQHMCYVLLYTAASKQLKIDAFTS